MGCLLTNAQSYAVSSISALDFLKYDNGQVIAGSSASYYKTKSLYPSALEMHLRGLGKELHLIFSVSSELQSSF